MDLFLPSCARRLQQRTGRQLEPDDIAARIRLVDERGVQLPGSAGSYHSHAFHPESRSGDVPNAILTADLMVRDRAAVTLALVDDERGRERKARRELPVH